MIHEVIIERVVNGYAIRVHYHHDEKFSEGNGEKIEDYVYVVPDKDQLVSLLNNLYMEDE